MSITLVCGEILMNGSSIVTDPDCCDPCNYAEINPDCVVDGRGGNYAAVGPAGIIREDGEVYELTVDITRDVDPCTDSTYGTLTTNPTLSYVNGVTTIGDIWGENVDGSSNVWGEFWYLKCGCDPETLLGDPCTGSYWTMYGDWLNPSGSRTMGALCMVDENGTAAAWDGSAWVTTTGSFSVISFNPFHATGTITPQWAYPIPADEGGDTACGPVTVEFTE